MFKSSGTLFGTAPDNP